MQREGLTGGTAGIRVRATGGVLLVAHLCVVAWVSLRPLDVPWMAPPNLTPLAGIRADLEAGTRHAVRCLGGGLALLAPLGVLLPAVHGRLWASPVGSLVRTVAAGALIALGIELLQTSVPGQNVDVDSVLLGVAGVGLAHLAVVPAGRVWLRRRAARREGEAVPGDDAPRGRTPRFPRVGVAP